MINKTRRQIKWFSLVRILGLTLVLTYHFNGQFLPGGFIGVDVFFTFSGFLITSLMIDEFNRQGNFGLAGFYRRRFFRIFPPLFLSVLLVIPLTYLVSPDYVVGLGRQIAAALGFVTNIFEDISGGSYEAKFIPHLFVHTWSLAVEMHFYLSWGLISWLLSLWARRQPEERRLKVYRVALFGASFILAMTTLALMLIQSRGLTEFSPVYFSSFTHSFPFFIGASVGTLSGVVTVRQKFKQLMETVPAIFSALGIVLGAGGLILLATFLHFGDLATYQWGLLLAVLLTAVMIISARMLDERTQDLREPRIFVYLADTSYSMYLYHWPFFVIFSKLFSIWQAVGLTVGLGLLISTVSYYVIEPVVAGQKGRFFGRSIGGVGFGVPLLLMIGGLTYVDLNRVLAAPDQTALESSLWTEKLYQSRDDLVIGAKELLPASQKKGDDKKVGSNDYTVLNRNSTAAENGIPTGVTIIGDSVTLGVRRALIEGITESDVDAAGDRLLGSGVDLILAMQEEGTLREFVVVNLGTNALGDYEKQLERLRKGLAPGHKLILTTPYNRNASPSWNSFQTAIIERDLAKDYAWITLADWEAIANQHPELFEGTDGVHFAGRKQGEKLYTDMLNEALREAARAEPKPKD